MTIEVPAITYPPELPVSRMRGEIATAIAGNQVVILAGETGSGKTTQLPKICLDLGRESIAHTQPRRIAARTIAERIAEELHVELGTLVGYSVRFTDETSAATRIRLMTDGILLAEIRRDRQLRRYDTIILDEAHERSLNIDFLLGYLKQLLPQRPDLKLIITSATIDVERFAEHFGTDGTPAPVVEVSGRTYPVEIRYRPLVAEGTADGDDVDERAGVDEDRDLTQGIGDALDELGREMPGGDVLVFLSGESEIRDVTDALRGRYANDRRGRHEILPLYGRLSSAEQHRVFERSTVPGVLRRIILATNVAETSLTVPGIRAVVDGGTARISRYSTRAKVQRLPIEPISQASARQRSGRAGRTSDGIAIRLYSEADFDKRPEFTDPEILRTNLAAVILQMISLGLGDIAAFPFVQPPDSRGIAAGLDLLTELGALQRDGSLTATGRDLARLPLDPRFARMLLESRGSGVTAEVIAIVAGLTIQDPRERPVEQRPQADTAHARFTDATSDFLTLLNLWRHLETKRAELSGSAFRRMCRAEFLNFVRIREWQDLVRQLTRLARDVRLTGADAPAAEPDADAIHKSLLAGLLSQLGLRDDRAAPPSARGRPNQRRPSTEFVGARQTRFWVFPGSALAKRPPKALMTAELVETSRLFARMNAAVDPAWAERIAGDLVKRSYGEPRWERRQGSAVADERVTLYGVPIVEKRRVRWARIDPAHARALFIDHALIEGDWPRETARDRAFDFDRANRALLDDLEDELDRTRSTRRIDEARILDFFDARIPADVTDVRSFETWWHRAMVETPDLLTMRRSDLLEPDALPDVDETRFPPTWRQAEQTLALKYRFSPGAADDGVTAVVPLPLLAGLSPVGFDWQVPGMRVDLITALIRTLPKPIRRNVVPAADWAARLSGVLPAGPEDLPTPGPLVDALALAIRRLSGAAASAADFELERLPQHLRIAFEVIDERGRMLGRDTDLVALQQRLAAPARRSVARVASGPSAPSLERRGLTTFDIDEIPRVLDVPQAGGIVRAYPALVDRGTSVDLLLFTSVPEQAAAMRLGIRRLLLLGTPSPASYVQRHLSAGEALALAASPYPSTAALFDDCLTAVVAAVQQASASDGLVWTRDAFAALQSSLAGRVVDDLFTVVASAAAALSFAREADAAIRAESAPAASPALDDARRQVNALIHPGFIALDGAARLTRLPVYLRGVVHRVQRLSAQINRDRGWMTEVETATALYRAAGGTLPVTVSTPAHLVHVRWLLEEFRLSLFAQHLGTAEPASLPRIRRALDQYPQL